MGHLSPDWVVAVLAIFSVLLIPTLLFIVRGTVKWTRTEDKLTQLVDSIGRLVSDKDKVHTEILEQMRVDRESTDKRLRFIEEFWMRRGTEDTFRN